MREGLLSARLLSADWAGLEGLVDASMAPLRAPAGVAPAGVAALRYVGGLWVLLVRARASVCVCVAWLCCAFSAGCLWSFQVLFVFGCEYICRSNCCSWAAYCLTCELLTA